MNSDTANSPKSTQNWKAKIADRVRDRATLKSILRKYRQSVAEAEDDLVHAVEALDIAQNVAKSIQEHIHNQIAGVVTRCLECVFPDNPYEFRITFERKRNQTECNLSFVRDGLEVDPTTASGGGAVDVAAFALRLAALMLNTPRKRRLVVLDEPFKFVSQEYRDNVREMLNMLSTEMGVQFIMVTHIEELQTGSVVTV